MFIERDEMMESIEKELTFLDSMKREGTKNITFAEGQVDKAIEQLRLATELQARFGKRTEMCWKLRDALEEFGGSLETLKAM